MARPGGTTGEPQFDEIVLTEAERHLHGAFVVLVRGLECLLEDPVETQLDPCGKRAWVTVDAQLDRLVGELSTGVRRVVDLACATALRPRVLLLDEPSDGLASAEALALPAVLRQVRDNAPTP